MKPRKMSRGWLGLGVGVGVVSVVGLALALGNDRRPPTALVIPSPRDTPAVATPPASVQPAPLPSAAPLEYENQSLGFRVTAAALRERWLSVGSTTQANGQTRLTFQFDRPCVAFDLCPDRRINVTEGPVSTKFAVGTRPDGSAAIVGGRSLAELETAWRAAFPPPAAVRVERLAVSGWPGLLTQLVNTSIFGPSIQALFVVRHGRLIVFSGTQFNSVVAFSRGVSLLEAYESFHSPALGFSATSIVYDEPWSQVGASADGGLNFIWPCKASACPQTIEVRNEAVPTTFILGFTPGFDVLSARGSTLDDLRRTWSEAYGDARFADVGVSGWPGLLATGSRAVPGSATPIQELGLFVLHRGSILAATGPGGSFRPIFDRFIASLVLDDNPTERYSSTELGFSVDAGATGPWSRAQRGAFGAGPGPADQSTVAFWLGNCLDNLCSGGYVTVASGDADTGAVAAGAGRGVEGWLRVAGATVAELEASWSAQFGTSHFETIPVAGTTGLLARNGDRQAVLLLAKGRVFVISISPAPFDAAFDGRKPLLEFVARFRVLA